MENHESHSTSDNDQQNVTPASKRGGWGAIKYILGNESFEKLASMCLVSNLVLYLRSKYNLNGIFLVNVVSIWSGSTNISSIAGAVVSDVYLGRYLTLLFGSIASLLGMATITLTAAFHPLRPPPCHDPDPCQQPHGWQLAVLFVGLGLIAVGAGGIRPCNIAFGADQFDTRTKKGRAQLESFFNWWYLLFTVALLIALTVVVYIQTNISWTIGFAIPTICFVFSITIFIIGRGTYIYRPPEGSVFVDMAKVIVASHRKRKIPNNNRFYNPISPEIQDFEEQIIKTPVLTDRFNCLNKAAMITDPNEIDDQGIVVNTWNLCTLEHVEQLKCLIGIIPVWLSGIGCFVVMDQQSTFGILQGIQMNKKIGHSFKIPPAWMTLGAMLALSLWIFIYERIYIPWSKKTSKKAKRLTMAQRIQTGIIMSILCMLSAGFIERKRRSEALKNHSFISPIIILYLVPQFVLSGLTEAFAAVACMEFFTIQMPETMRSVSGAVFFLSLSVGSYMSSLIVNVIHKTTQKPGKTPWLGGNDLNKNKLDYYYFFIAAIGAVNFFYFTFFARKFVVSGKSVSLNVGDVELNERLDSEKDLDESVEKEEERDKVTGDLNGK